MVLTIDTTQEVEEVNKGGHFDVMTPQRFYRSFMLKMYNVEILLFLLKMYNVEILLFF